MSALDEDSSTPAARGSRLGQWAAITATVLVAYVISVGPVLAICCWLADYTDWEGFYAVFYLYLLPLYPLRDFDLLESYVMWWMKLLGTMPPG